MSSNSFVKSNLIQATLVQPTFADKCIAEMYDSLNYAEEELKNNKKVNKNLLEIKVRKQLDDIAYELLDSRKVQEFSILMFKYDRLFNIDRDYLLEDRIKNYMIDFLSDKNIDTQKYLVNWFQYPLYEFEVKMAEIYKEIDENKLHSNLESNQGNDYCPVDEDYFHPSYYNSLN